MSNPHEMVYVNDFTSRISTAAIRFDEWWKAGHARDKENYPLNLALIDWLDHFQAWLDIDEFQLPATLHPEIIDADNVVVLVPKDAAAKEKA